MAWPAASAGLLLWLICAACAAAFWPAPAAAQAPAGSYTVVAGDSLSKIAAQFGVSQETLIAANGIANPDLLAVGQVLVIPAGGNGAVVSAANAATANMGAAAADLGSVRALPGETVAALAARVSRAPADIASLNSISEATRLFPGEPIRVPLAAVPRPPLYFGPLEQVKPSDTIVQGHTGRVYVDLARPATVAADWLGQALVFTPIDADGLHRFAFLPAPPLQDPGAYTLTLRYVTGQGVAVSRQWPISVTAGDYDSQTIDVPDEVASQMTPAAIEAEITKVVGIWSQVSPQLRWQGVMQRPIDEQYPTTSPYGTRRVYSVADMGNFHAGQDFGAPEGAVVTAPAAGAVVLAEPLTVRGNAVIIDHGRGVFTGYWHLSEIKVQVGQLLNPGDMIGLVGTSGLSTGAHLHWEMRINGVAVDPLQFLDEPPYTAE